MKAEESYENLAESFQNVFAEINNMVDDPTLTIDQENYKVIFYFCSDYRYVKLFTSLKGKCDGYAPDKVTPYMHIMALHLKKVITNHGNLYKFSCQGMSLWYIYVYRSAHAKTYN